LLWLFAAGIFFTGRTNLRTRLRRHCQQSARGNQHGADEAKPRALAATPACPGRSASHRGR
jgi:hypothetical protein